MPTVLIYGASGYTGRLATSHAVSLSLDIILGGRLASTATVSLAKELGVTSRLFSLDSPISIDTGLKGVSVLLNCAGPFHRTAAPLIEGCIRNNVHYLDIAAELDSYKLAEKYDAAAKAVGVMLLPGCGGSVTMLGCLAAHTISRHGTRSGEVESIDVSLYVSGPVSRGSAISAAENMSADTFSLADGKMVTSPPGSTLELDFDTSEGAVTNYAVTLPDLITIFRATGAPNIRTFVHATSAFPTGNLEALPDGPTQEEREGNPYHAVAIATLRGGAAKRSVLHTSNGYSFTGRAAVEGAKRLMEMGKVEGGWWIPVSLFGAGFLGEAVPGSVIIDV